MIIFSNFFNTSQMSFDPLNFLGLLATALVTIYIFKSELPFSFTKERHEKLIFPLFNLLEPSLYQEVNMDLLIQALKIIENNKYLVDGKLLSIYYYCKKNPTKEHYINLCSYVDHAYDKSCRMLKFKKRTIEYRINRHQYKSKAYVITYILSATLLFALSLLIALIGLASLVLVFKSIFNSTNDFTQVVLCLFASVSTLAIIKYAEKHF